MNISVIIPVYNEEKRIKECLDALYDNSLKPFEIIVADGGSTDKTVDIIKCNYPEVKIVNNIKKTAGSGRNVAIEKAKGDIVAFTDGDCIVHKRWIESIDKVFTTNDVDGIGGKVKNAEPENYIEEYWGNLAWNLIMNFGDEPYVIKERTLNDAFVTANCAYKRERLLQIGGFSEWFGNNAEDVDVSWRMLENGAKLMYVPDMVIYAHNVTTIGGVIKKSFRNGVSSSKLQKKYGTLVNFDPNIYKMLFKNFIGIFRKSKDAGLNLVELSFHLFGKYYGSIRVGVINI